MIFVHQFGTVVCLFFFLLIQGLLLVHIINKFRHGQKVTVSTFLMLFFGFLVTWGLYHFLDMTDEAYLLPVIVMYAFELLLLLAYNGLKRR